jgi:PucR C-terminal helix-turn-helix domain
VAEREAPSRDEAWDALMDCLLGAGVLDGHGPLAERMAQRVFVLPSYKHVRQQELHDSWRRNMSVSLDGIRSRRPPGPGDDDTPLREVGEMRARQGVTVSEVLQTSIIHQTVFLELVRELAPSSPHRDSLLLELFSNSQRWAAWGMVALAAGHRDAELEIQRRAQEHQDSFVQRILSGSIATSEIGEGAEAFGLDRSRHYRAFRLRLGPSTDVRAMERYLHITSSGARRNGMMTIIDGDLCGFLATLPEEPPQTAIGVSPPAPLHELAAVFRLATRALETALAIGRHEIVGVADLGLHPAIVADHDLGELMYDRYVTPFERLGASGAVILETVERYVENGSRLETTRQQLFLHTNTVRYRLSRFESITGCSLRDSRALVEVWWALAWRRLNSPNADGGHIDGSTRARSAM